MRLFCVKTTVFALACFYRRRRISEIFGAFQDSLFLDGFFFGFAFANFCSIRAVIVLIPISFSTFVIFLVARCFAKRVRQCEPTLFPVLQNAGERVLQD